MKTETEEDKTGDRATITRADLLPSVLLVQQRWHNSHVYMITCKHRSNLQFRDPVLRRGKIQTEFMHSKKQAFS